LNKIIKVLISFSGRANFFLSIYGLQWTLPYHALNSEFANFETPCIPKIFSTVHAIEIDIHVVLGKNLFFHNTDIRKLLKIFS
jgi:hypothetical protein